MSYKTVLLKITVPAGKHCCKGGSPTCEHLDADGFGSGCGLGMGKPQEDENGWELKPIKCLHLNDASD